MIAPYGLDVAESCLTCKGHELYRFCNLPRFALEELDALKSVAIYPPGAVLFVEGQPCRGVFVLCQGHAKLLTSSRDGKTIILRISQPGEVLGLSAALAGRPYLATAKVMEPTHANFFRLENFVSFLRKHSEAAFRAAQVLSCNYRAAYGTIRSLGISHSVPEKLARLILEWAAGAEQEEQNGTPIPTRATFTHKEIAEMIGASRVTVTRLLNDFKRKQMIRWNGSAPTIVNRAALKKLLGY